MSNLKTILMALSLASMGLFITSNSLAVDGYDDPQPRKASDVLPPDLVTGKHFRVLDNVTWSEGLHEFTVETEFGSFEVWGEPMLHVRLAEVDAWYELENTSSAEAAAKSVGKSAVRSVGSLAKAFAHPLKTIKGTPTGISRMFPLADLSKIPKDTLLLSLAGDADRVTGRRVERDPLQLVR